MGIKMRGSCSECALEGHCGRTVGDIFGGCSSGYQPKRNDTSKVLELSIRKGRKVWQAIRWDSRSHAEDAVIAALEGVCHSRGIYPVTMAEYEELIRQVTE